MFSGFLMVWAAICVLFASALKGWVVVVDFAVQVFFSALRLAMVLLFVLKRAVAVFCVSFSL